MHRKLLLPLMTVAWVGTLVGVAGLRAPAALGISRM